MKPRSIFRFVRSIRQMLPPTGYVSLAAFLLILMEVLWSVLGGFAGPNAGPDQLLITRDATVAILLTAYGVFRVLAFHPLFSTPYLEWLERTPWQPGLPLPLGHVRLAWQDVFIAGGLALLLEDGRPLFDPNLVRIRGLSGVLLFLQAHALMLTCTVWLTGPRWIAYLSAFLLPLSMRLSESSPIVGLICLIAGILADHYGLAKSWHLFPWRETRDWAARLKSGFKNAQQRMQQNAAPSEAESPDRVPPSELGWPFGVCSPYVEPEAVSRREGLLLAALCGFWLHAMLCRFPEIMVNMISGFCSLYLTLGLVIGKGAMYGSNHHPPISLWGRFRTFQWIIPRYDAVILGPLAVLLVPAGGFVFGYLWLKIPLTILTPVVLTLTFWAMLFAGPRARHWKLTAPARIVPGRLNAKMFDELS